MDCWTKLGLLAHNLIGISLDSFTFTACVYIYIYYTPRVSANFVEMTNIQKDFNQRITFSCDLVKWKMGGFFSALLSG